MAIPPFTSVPIAGVIPFDNSTNGFAAQDVQTAIEEAKITLNNPKFEQIYASLSAYDKVVEIFYLDVGTKSERIDSVELSSVLYPDANIVKNIFWLDVGTMNQRIDKEEIVGAVFAPQSLRKTYAYSTSGIRYKRDGYTLALF